MVLLRRFKIFLGQWISGMLFSLFSIVLIPVAAAVHDTWREDGEENEKEERNFLTPVK